MKGGVLNIHTTTRCTMKCRDCSWHFPKFKDFPDEDINKQKESLKRAFEIFDWVDECRIGGGEAFLYAELVELIQETVKYKKQFKTMSLITNGTIVPKNDFLETFSALSCDKFIRVDDYGAGKSTKIEEVLSALKEYDIPVDFRPYNEEEMSFGGWVDLGDFDYKSYKEERLEYVYDNCRIPPVCLCIWDGKLFNCTYHAAGYMLGAFDVSADEYVNLFDGDDREKWRDDYRKLSQRILTGCQYCNGFDPENSPRIPAAIQIGDENEV